AALRAGNQAGGARGARKAARRRARRDLPRGRAAVPKRRRDRRTARVRREAEAALGGRLGPTRDFVSGRGVGVSAAYPLACSAAAGKAGAANRVRSTPRRVGRTCGVSLRLAPLRTCLICRAGFAGRGTAVARVCARANLLPTQDEVLGRF